MRATRLMIGAAILLAACPATVRAATAPGLGRACATSQWGTKTAGVTCALVAKGKYVWVQLPEAAPTPAATAATKAPAPATSTKTSRTNPGPLGAAQTLVDVNNGNIEIVVDGFVADASAQIAAANSFNKPAPEGQRYVMVHLTATYHAGVKKDKANLFGVSFSMFGSMGVERKESDCGAVEPDGLDSFRDIVDGGKLTGNICYLLPVAEATGPLVFGADSALCFTNCSEAWFKVQ